MELVRTAALRRYLHHDLGALISLYEGNYLRLLRLIPELDAFDGTVVSRVSGGLDLYLTVIERSRYTTSVRLTYRFDDDRHFALEPNARICLYHDVRAAEIISHYRRRQMRRTLPWRRGHMPEVERRWRYNRFLHKWLRFCTHQGHLFLRCTARPARLPVED